MLKPPFGVACQQNPHGFPKYLVLIIRVSTFPESWVGIRKHWDAPALQQEGVCRDQGSEGMEAQLG